jgi:hypothetical protein
MKSLLIAAAIAACMAVGAALKDRQQPGTDLLAEPKAEQGYAELYNELYDKRMQRLTDLDNYIAAGNFPQNSTLEGEMIPVFVDNEGNACAVAYLMLCDGQSALVEEVREKNNNVKLHELTEGKVVDWMLRSGLTKEECELIQPEYNWPEPKVPSQADRFITSRLTATARKLRKDTALSMALIMERLQGDRPGVSMIIDDKDFAATGWTAPNAMLIRVTKIGADGKADEPGKWRPVPAGATASPDKEQRGKRLLVEMARDLGSDS